MPRAIMIRAAGLAILVAAAAACAVRAPVPPPRTTSPVFDLDEATIADLQQRMASGRDTARSLAEKYLARIQALDRQGPSLHAVIEVNPDALAIADALDAERRLKGPRGPLHGIPVLIKDNIATADHMETTAGSLALVGARPPDDAFLVRRLREVGAVILGKTNLSEWANFRSTRSSSGWSARGGQTRNAYALDRSPSGSSSGSAVAVAANLAAVAIGTETDGSVVSPASNASIVGIKPTLGLVSRSGIVPISHSQDTAGPMARTVTDAATLLAAMAGVDPGDPATAAAAPHLPVDYTTALDPNGLQGARIGIMRNAGFGANPAVDRLAEAAIAVMRARGATIVDPANVPTLGRFDASELQVLLYEFKADLDKYLLWLGPAAPVHSLEDVIAFNTRHAAQEEPFFGQELMIEAAAKGPLTSPAYLDALASDQRLARTDGLDAILNGQHLDALVAPTALPAWLIDHVNGDSVPVSAASSTGPTSVAAVAGYPHITVPMGYVKGLPVGLSFVGRAWSEPTLIRLAYAYEQATHLRRPPQFAPTAD